MIGNDIVDWAQAKQESNWQRKGFLTKLFTREEQQLIHEANDSERMVWTLWCLKESVYKASVRQTGERLFAPQKIVCQLTSSQNDAVEGIAFYNSVYQIRASLTADYVAGVAFRQDNPPIFREGIVSFADVVSVDRSAYLYHRVIHDFATDFSLSIHTISIRKNENGVPILDVADAPDQPLISLSHHGRYGAYVVARFQHLP